MEKGRTPISFALKHTAISNTFVQTIGDIHVSPGASGGLGEYKGVWLTQLTPIGGDDAERHDGGSLNRPPG